MLENLEAAAEAIVLRCGFNIGCFDKNQIEKWAESQIAATVKPSIELIDLAILRNTHPVDVMKLLAVLGEGIPAAKTLAIQVGFIGVQFENGALTLVSAIRALFSLQYEPGISLHEKNMLYWFDDAYDWALTGHESMANVESELRKFIEPYVERLQGVVDLMKVQISKPG
jgi:hypothetical protein